MLFHSKQIDNRISACYREGHSKSTAITQMTDDKIIGGLLDFSAAFDIIDHSPLLEKYMCYAFTPPAIMWIKSYLPNRTQRVFFNGSLSDIIQLESRIPQGSCLGPLLFSIFTNGMPLTLALLKV